MNSGIFFLLLLFNLCQVEPLFTTPTPWNVGTGMFTTTVPYIDFMDGPNWSGARTENLKEPRTYFPENWIWANMLSKSINCFVNKACERMQICFDVKLDK